MDADWDIVTDNSSFGWRSDLSRIEVIAKKMETA